LGARCSPIQISVTLEKVLEPLVKAICNHYHQSSDKHPTSGFTNIFQLFLSAANAPYGNLTLTLSINNFGVYHISLLSDLCIVDYTVPIAVLTTKYKYVQHKYAN